MAIAFGEKSSPSVRRRLARFDRLLSSNLLEAELRAALAREKSSWTAALVAPIDWILPSRPLGPEMDRALQTGYLRGADLWHVSCALYLAGGLGPVTFMTLDVRQREVARELGMPAPEA